MQDGDRQMRVVALIAIISDELYEEARAVAQEHHAHGITFVPARGIGFPEHLTFFGLTFQGSSWVMLSLLDADKAHAAQEKLNQRLHLEQRFAGLVFTAELDQIPESLLSGGDTR